LRRLDGGLQAEPEHAGAVRDGGEVAVAALRAQQVTAQASEETTAALRH